MRLCPLKIRSHGALCSEIGSHSITLPLILCRLPELNLLHGSKAGPNSEWRMARLAMFARCPIQNHLGAQVDSQPQRPLMRPPGSWFQKPFGRSSFSSHLYVEPLVAHMSFKTQDMKVMRRASWSSYWPQQLYSDEPEDPSNQAAAEDGFGAGPLADAYTRQQVVLGIKEEKNEKRDKCRQTVQKEQTPHRVFWWKRANFDNSCT